MSQLPQMVIDAREEANVAADAQNAAWDALQEIEEPTHVDVEKWIAVREKFYASQEKFERLLWQAIGR